MNTRVYTEEDLTSAVKEAVAPVQAELETLRASLAEDAQIADLQAKLDAAEIRATEAEAARDEIVAWLNSEEQAIAEAAAYQERKAARLAAIKESASFGDEYIESNIDRWTALDDEAFEALVEDWKAVATAARAPREDANLSAEIPAETAMQHTIRTNGSESGATELFELMRNGFDPRAL